MWFVCLVGRPRGWLACLVGLGSLFAWLVDLFGWLVWLFLWLVGWLVGLCGELFAWLVGLSVVTATNHDHRLNLFFGPDTLAHEDQ